MAVITALVVVIWYLSLTPSTIITLQVPGLDNAPAGKATRAGRVSIGANFQRSDSVSSDLKGKWPRFRGFDYNNIIHDPALPSNFITPDKTLEILWSVDLGEGHAGPAIYNGMVYILDYDEQTRSDALRCLSLETGKELWRRWYPVSIKRNHGYSRTVPAVTDSFVVTMGPNCHVMAVGRHTGNLLWGLDLARDYGTKVPMWFTGQCPLIVGNTAILAPGGSSLLIGINCRTGQVVWNTPNPDNWQMSHSSVIPMSLYGRKMYIYCALQGIAAVAADGQDIGKVLWSTTIWRQSVIAPSPVKVSENRIYVSAGYGAGGMLMAIDFKNGIFTARALQKVKPSEGLASEQQTPIYYNGHLYSILPKDAGLHREQFVSCSPKDLTRYHWFSGKTRRFGLGPYLLINGYFFIVGDDGALTVVQADKKQYKEVFHKKILPGKDAWGPLAYADGRLLMRDDKTMVCVRLNEVVRN